MNRKNLELKRYEEYTVQQKRKEPLYSKSFSETKR